MDEISLRPFDGLAIAGLLMLPGLLFTWPATLSGQSAGAGWMALLGAHLAVLPLFLIVTWLMGMHRGKDLILAASATLGRPFGALYGVLLAAYFCFSTGLLLREGAEVFRVYGLSLTPVPIIAGLTLIAALIMNLFGGRAIIKSAGFFFLLLLLGLVFVMILGLNRYNPDHIFPILGYGGQSIAHSGLGAAGMIDGVIILALFAPSFAGTGKMRKAGLLALALSGGVSAAFYLCLIMMFSPAAASGMISGFMEMGKSIYYNRFFYRFESVLLFFLIFSSLLTACLGLYIARKSAAIAFGGGSPKAFAAVCGGIIFAVALIPADLFDLSSRYLDFTRRYSIFFIAGVPVFLLLISAVKRVFLREK